MKQIIPLVLITYVASTCIEYEPNNPPYYCEDIITWHVSQAVWDNRWSLNKQAYQLYFELKNKYELKEDDSPSLECLAVARKFYCSYSFPYCTVDEEERGVCDFLCDIWEKRCPDEEYERFCKDSESSRCSWAGMLSFVSMLLVIIVV
jgi:hypothetical protein